MAAPTHILVFRFSALGDIAMTVPVTRLLLAQYPDLRVTVATAAFAAPVFEGIDRLHVHAVDTKGAHKGVAGLMRLRQELPRDVDAIADLHGVLRTTILRGLYTFSGIRKAVIDKGRTQKAALTRVEHKVFQPLPSTFQRYADVFAALGRPVDLDGVLDLGIHGDHAQRAGRSAIGIAPFAKHPEKTYPLESMKEVVRMLVADGTTAVLLFGGKAEAPLLEQWASDLPGVRSVAGTMGFREELAVIAGLDLMVSMDSANMHLASLFGVPVVSVWGSTHPFAGFYGWRQDPAHIVQVDLYCRPCSVFGNRRCYRGDLACLHSISPVMVVDRIWQALGRL
ncbi:MAG: ADP-heptose:LPS heptosyltransferase [Flaviaesturariibacter sp.]|nr:ADP-heptose:LPS heptosyltransferase [Flaviaesturariibacter sp.]